MARVRRHALVAFTFPRTTCSGASARTDQKGKGDTMNTTISFTKYDSPLGLMLATAERGALTGLYFVDQRYFPKSTEGWREDPGASPFSALREQLDAYYAGA